MTAVRRRGRRLAAVRLTWGALLLARPRSIDRLVGGTQAPAARRATRILGARHVGQALVELGWWPRYWRAGAFLDASHAASLVVLAAARPRWRRLALNDSIVAAAFFLGDLLAA